MTTKRIFIAFDISDEARNAAAKYIDGLRSVYKSCPASWAKPEKLHFTLRFLGDIDVARIDKVCEAASAAAETGDAELRLDSTGVFPSPGRARVLWLGAKGDLETISSLKRKLDQCLKELGFGEDQKRFTPHLTVARIKDPHACGPLVEAHLESGFHTAPFNVSEIVLYESQLHPAGSIYTPLNVFKFKRHNAA